MSFFGFSLILAAAFCHATWNYCIKRVNGGPELIWLVSVISVALYLPIAVWFTVIEPTELKLEHIGMIAVSAALHLGYFLLLQVGYRHGELSVVYPTARATGPVLSASFAVAFLGEQLSFHIAAGGALIIFGVLMLSGGFRLKNRNALISMGFGGAAGILIGFYTAWDAYAVSVILIPPLLLEYASNVGRAAILAPIALRRRELVRNHWRDHRGMVLAIAVFNPLAYILFLYALTFTPVVYAAPMREVSVLLTVIAGSVLLKEGMAGQRLGWSVVILLGMAILVSS